ncbi:MAG: FtsW/RodA/SpoVE family cell cycle protein [Vicinamibacterales bacterium]
MTVSYLSAADRDTRRDRRRARRFGVSDLLLWATSCVALFTIALAYTGRVRIFEASEAQHADIGHVNLNTVLNASDIEPALAASFPNTADRRFAATELFRFVQADRSAGRTQSNVGAISRATVSVDTVERSRQLDAFSRRAQAEREKANAGGDPRLASLALLTATDLVAVKPFFVVRTRDAFRQQLIWFAGLYLLGFQVIALIWRLRGTRGDRVLLAAIHLLTAIGFAVVLSRVDPLRDNLLFVRYGEGVLVGLFLLLALSLSDFGTATFLSLSYLPLIGALSLSVLLILFGSGPGRSNAKVNLGPVQPIEAIRLLLAFFLAGYFARRWELLRDLRGRAIRTLTVPAWLDVPRAEYVLPVVVAVAMALGFFFLQKDLGPALLLSCVFLAAYAVARGRTGLAVAGLLLLVAGFYVGYRLNVSHTLVERVRMWQSPWDNAVPGGDQVAQAIWALATGGPSGTGLGLGDPRYLPAGHTDLVLAAVGEELGLWGLIVVALAYAIVVWRGFRVSLSASNDYGFFLGTLLTLFLIVPVLVMAAGVMGITPLTGVVTPFLSYGGSAMAANCAAIGMLCSIHADRRPATDLAPFRAPVQWLGATLVASAATLIAFLINVQMVHADDYLVKPHLGVQADGGRRYAYNPRVIDLVRQLPRGTVYDRNGIPLATGNPAVIAAAREAYHRLGVSLDQSCPGLAERCYPLGGRAFHLLGDERTRLNWSAPNTSYVERDSENRLRGFDDRATTTSTSDASGRTMRTVRRDYRDLVPLLRHRYQPAHPDVVALRHQSNDLHLTIDAGLQWRLASIVASYARKSSGRAAAIVLDPDTGELLASASYPWPEAETPDTDGDVAAGAPDTLLDRARYGLYPPGSTFKLVTAAAAFRRGVNPATTTFACSRLPDGRVGARINGWNRPIRDDVLDTHPHGTIDMHDGLVHSCNAYFAQLAVSIGAGPLVNTAARLGISLTASKTPALRVRETLPQIGYGQGDVVATPLRMARVAAAIAADGVLREVHLEEASARPADPDPFLDRTSARMIASYMRDAVLTGTGRVLKSHPWRIAGKTGTAELTGHASHAWFVGFAPYGAATRRIAFAVIIENAGYGGASAAPVAGEIVTAAAQSGLVQ